MAKDWGPDWRLVPPKGRESCRWQSIDNSWVSLSLGHQGDITKIVIASSDGRSEIVEGYEEGLNLARRWRQAGSARRSGNFEKIPLVAAYPRVGQKATDDSDAWAASRTSRPGSRASNDEFRTLSTGPTITLPPGSSPAVPNRKPQETPGPAPERNSPPSRPEDRWSQPTIPTDRWSQPTVPTNRWSQPTQPGADLPLSLSSPSQPPERWPRATLPPSRSSAPPPPSPPPVTRRPRTARPPLHDLTHNLPPLKPEEDPILSPAHDMFSRPRRPSIPPLQAPTGPGGPPGRLDSGPVPHSARNPSSPSTLETDPADEESSFEDRPARAQRKSLSPVRR